MSLKAWQERVVSFIAGAPIQETWIAALRRQVGRGGSTETRNFLTEQCTYPMKRDWNITPEQGVKGRAFLMSVEIWGKLTPSQRGVMESFSHFTFRGVKVYQTGVFAYHVAPVYRVHSKKRGMWFDYSSSPWQQDAYGGTSTRFDVVADSSTRAVPNA